MIGTGSHAYDLDDRVQLPGCSEDAVVIGVITAVMRDADGISYRVVWWHDGYRRHEWLYPHEIRPSSARAVA